MIPTRAALAIPAALLVLSGCGAAATHAPRTTTVSLNLPASAPAIPATALLRPLPIITPAPTYIVASVAAASGGGNEWVEILTPSGKIVARTEVDPSYGPMAGPGGAYWTANNALYELTPSGAVRTLGMVPDGVYGVVIAPDGVSYAYTTSAPLDNEPSNQDTVNKIMVMHPGSIAKAILDTVATPNDVYGEDSGGWSYSLVNWTNAGIAFVRVPEGMCGCGGFELQMQSGYSAIVDPVSGGQTTVTASTSCPLSDLGPALESVCFAGTNATTAIRIATAGVVTHTYALSGKNSAGDALFSDTGSQLAYMTLPTGDSECDGDPITATLRVMNLATGSTVNRYMGDFVPSAWTGGLIYGTVTNDTTYASYVVSVNPATLAVTRLTPSGDSASVIGVV
jgi:hypothetical protein